MKWLITGGCGFLGTSLIQRLIRQGAHSIRVIDNLSVGTKEDLGSVCRFVERNIEDIASEFQVDASTYVELIEGDILDDELAVKASEGIDVIVHLAANTGVIPSIENPRKDCITNVIGTFNYLEAARAQSVMRFILASSGGTVIGNCEPPIHEELAPHPVSPYGASKLAGEGYCSAYFQTFGIETVALRFGNVYGPGSGHKNSAVAKFIRRALKGETLEIYGDGAQTRDFIYVEDLVDAIVKSANTEGVGGEIFQVATSSETSVNEIAEKLDFVFRKESLPSIKISHVNPLPGEVRRNFADTSKAFDMLGWRAQTTLEEGLLKTVKWYRESL